MQTPAAPPRLRLLIVDDDELTLAGLERVLQVEHDVVAVTNAAEALELVRKGTRFDVILCDLHMPGFSGMELHSVLSELAQDQAARMVFSTGDTVSTSAQQFLRRVPNRHLQKPFGVRAIREVLQSFLPAAGSKDPVRSS